MLARLQLLLFLLPLKDYQVNCVQCPVNDPLPVHHEWYQPGDLFIGAIASHYVFMTYEFSFEENPSRDVFFDLPV